MFITVLPKYREIANDLGNFKLLLGQASNPRDLKIELFKSIIFQTYLSHFSKLYQ